MSDSTAGIWVAGIAFNRWQEVARLHHTAEENGWNQLHIHIYIFIAVSYFLFSLHLDRIYIFFVYDIILHQFW